ncbi:MAG: histidinol dehydrogenase [Planctomycetes bacterium]|nr:histidinol dehydrogenase [Planctomycetota bacterium]
MTLLARITKDQIPAARRAPLDAATLADAGRIMNDVRTRGAAALREYAEKFGDRQPGEELVIDAPALRRALESLPRGTRGVLERAADRIRAFADAQRRAICDLDIAVPGGRAGHTVSPVDRAGCYAPGGRFPLPSSVLMTAVTARAAGVSEVWIASPKPTVETLAAAAIAGADAVLACGGAQAIAALAFGVEGVPACDTIVGPGNRWVTAAKQLATQVCTIDMLAGPSEVLVIADASASAAVVAADLLAQAEHDSDAIPMLVSTSESLIGAVEAEIELQLATLPTAATARGALRNGFAVLAADSAQACAISDAIAPEHLELLTEDAETLATKLRHYGALFIGGRAAEVLGDYGAGPNHVLPTGGLARSVGGLSVLNFLRVRTWLKMDDSPQWREVCSDAAALGRIEGLEAHSRAAEARVRG